MLVITRRVDEKIFIGDDITITVCRVKSNEVRIGIEAPMDVKIVRDESHKDAKNLKEMLDAEC
jgi:carbon storage regulator